LNFNYFVTQDECGAELYIDRGKDLEAQNKAIFDQLEAHRREIEDSFGGQLSWERLEGKRACRIRYSAPGGYRSPEEQWPALQDAVIHKMKRLEQALRPWLNQLKIAN
jgi:hypothetical protein